MEPGSISHKGRLIARWKERTYDIDSRMTTVVEKVTVRERGVKERGGEKHKLLASYIGFLLFYLSTTDVGGG